MLLLGKVALGMTGVILAGIGMLSSEGFVYVKVIEKQAQGHHIDVIAPAVLAPIAAHFIPQGNLRDASQQFRQYLPAINAALKSLQQTDDFVIVEVKEPDEHVRVMKSGGSIVVDVDDPNETVHVSAPLRAMSDAVDQIAAAAGQQ
jgi:hypothetical protein